MTDDGLRPDVQVAIDRLHLNGIAKHRLMRVFRSISDLVRDDETVEWTTGNGLLVLTDRRLFSLRSARNPQITEDFALETLSVQWRSQFPGWFRWLGPARQIAVFASGKLVLKLYFLPDKPSKELLDLMRRHLSGRVHQVDHLHRLGTWQQARTTSQPGPGH